MCIESQLLLIFWLGLVSVYREEREMILLCERKVTLDVEWVMTEWALQKFMLRRASSHARGRKQLINLNRYLLGGFDFLLANVNSIILIVEACCSHFTRWEGIRWMDVSISMILGQWLINAGIDWTLPHCRAIGLPYTSQCNVALVYQIGLAAFPCPGYVPEYFFLILNIQWTRSPIFTECQFQQGGLNI